MTSKRTQSVTLTGFGGGLKLRDPRHQEANALLVADNVRLQKNSVETMPDIVYADTDKTIMEPQEIIPFMAADGENMILVFDGLEDDEKIRQLVFRLTGPGTYPNPDLW